MPWFLAEVTSICLRLEVEGKHWALKQGPAQVGQTPGFVILIISLTLLHRKKHKLIFLLQYCCRYFLFCQNVLGGAIAYWVENQSSDSWVWINSTQCAIRLIDIFNENDSFAKDNWTYSFTSPEKKLHKQCAQLYPFMLLLDNISFSQLPSSSSMLTTPLCGMGRLWVWNGHINGKTLNV